MGLATLEIFCFLLLGIRVEKCHVDRVDYFHLLVSIEDWFQELPKSTDAQVSYIKWASACYNLCASSRIL